jgi:hypothetical protein
MTQRGADCVLNTVATPKDPVPDLRLQRAVDDLRLHAQALQMDRVTVQPAGEAPRLATVVEESAEGLIRLATTDFLPAGPLRLEFNYSTVFSRQCTTGKLTFLAFLRQLQRGEPFLAWTGLASKRHLFCGCTCRLVRWP